MCMHQLWFGLRAWAALHRISRESLPFGRTGEPEDERGEQREREFTGCQNSLLAPDIVGFRAEPTFTRAGVISFCNVWTKQVLADKILPPQLIPAVIRRHGRGDPCSYPMICFTFEF